MRNTLKKFQGLLELKSIEELRLIYNHGPSLEDLEVTGLKEEVWKETVLASIRRKMRESNDGYMRVKIDRKLHMNFAVTAKTEYGMLLQAAVAEAMKEWLEKRGKL